MGNIKIELEEIQTVRVGYERVVSGLGHTATETATFYIVTDEKYQMENDGGFIGYMLDEEGVGFDSRPIEAMADGALFLNRIEEVEVKELIGEDLLEWHKDRMLAYEALTQTEASRPMGVCPRCNRKITMRTYGGTGVDRKPYHLSCLEAIHYETTGEDPRGYY